MAQSPSSSASPDRNMSSPGSTLSRKGTLLERAGTQLARAGSNLGTGMQRASTLPTDSKELTYAATMPATYDMESVRPFCLGLWKFNQFFGFGLGISLLAAMSCIQPIELYPEANDMLGITLLCGVWWVFEVVPIYITALMPLALMPLFKITSSELAAQSYWNMIQMLVIGTYLLDIALEEVDLPRRVTLKALLAMGVVKPSTILLCFMSLSWFLSVLCNNIAVTLMVTPFAISMMNAAEERARDEVAASGSGGSDSDSEVSGDFIDNPAAAQVQRFADAVLLGIAYASTAGGMATLTGSVTNEVLYGVGDLFDVIGYGKWALYALPVSLITLILAFLVIYFRYVRGLTLRTLTKEVLEAEYEDFLVERGPISRDEIVVASLQLVQFLLLLFRPQLSQLFQTPTHEPMLGDATLACLPAVLLFFFPSNVRRGQAVLTWRAVHEKFDFGLLILIGGGFAISSGFTQSGLNLAVGQAVSNFTESANPYSLHLMIIILTTVATQVFSAIGTATTALPSLYSASQDALHHPLGFILPATIACSFAFVLPTATPPNVVVLAKSQDLNRALRVRDFFCTGLPLTMLCIVVGGFISYVTGILVFDAQSPYPKWACADGISCVWVNVSGTVSGGRFVYQQACRLSTNMENCTLWNNTILNATPFLATVL